MKRFQLNSTLLPTSTVTAAGSNDPDSRDLVPALMVPTAPLCGGTRHE